MYCTVVSMRVRGFSSHEVKTVGILIVKTYDILNLSLILKILGNLKEFTYIPAVQNEWIHPYLTPKGNFPSTDTLCNAVEILLACTATKFPPTPAMKKARPI